MVVPTWGGWTIGVLPLRKHGPDVVLVAYGSKGLIPYPPGGWGVGPEVNGIRDFFGDS